MADQAKLPAIQITKKRVQLRQRVLYIEKECAALFACAAHTLGAAYR